MVDAVPVSRHRVEQAHGRGRRVEPDCVAEPAALGGVGAEHDRHLALGGRHAPQPGVAQGQAGQPIDAVGHGAVGTNGVADVLAVVDHLVEGEHRADDPSVELGDGDAGGGVVGPEAGRVVEPVGRRLPRRRRLDDRDVERRQRGGVPVVAVEPARPAGGAGAGRGAAGGQHGRDEHVELLPGQQVEGGPGRVAPQRVAPHCEHIAPTGLDGIAQVGHELGVPGHQMGPVEHDADQRPAPSRCGPLGPLGHSPDAVGRHLGRRVEAEAFEQHRVGHEPQQVLEVGRPAVHEVLERAGEDGAGHGRQCRQFGVGHRFAGEREEGDAPGLARRPQLVEPVLPGSPPPQQPHQHAGGAGQVTFEVERPRLGRPHRREAVGQRLDRRPQGQDLGVDVGDVPDHCQTISPVSRDGLRLMGWPRGWRSGRRGAWWPARWGRGGCSRRT